MEFEKGKFPEFICDSMFGKLTKWLRMIGYFAIYIKGTGRKNFLDNLNLFKDKIFITKDKKVKNEDIKIFYLDEIYVEEQFKIIIKEFNLNFNNAFTICIECNETLSKTDKDLNKEKIPEFVFKNFDEFYECKKCGRIYWKGSHFQAMQEKIKSFNL